MEMAPPNKWEKRFMGAVIDDIKVVGLINEHAIDRERRRTMIRCSYSRKKTVKRRSSKIFLLNSIV